MFLFALVVKKIFVGGTRKTRKLEKFEKKKFSIFGSKMTLLVEKLPRMNLGRVFRWFLIIFGHVFFPTIFDHCLAMFAGLSFGWIGQLQCQQCGRQQRSAKNALESRESDYFRMKIPPLPPAPYPLATNIGRRLPLPPSLPPSPPSGLKYLCEHCCRLGRPDY